jgi:hypothetical protein
MQRITAKAFHSVSLDNSIPVLLPCEFGERQGVAYITTKDRVHGTYVRRLDEREFDKRTAKGRAIVRSVAAEHLNFLRGVKILQRIRGQNDPVAERQAYELVASQLWRKPRHPPEDSALALMRQSVARLLSHPLSDARLVFWLIDEGRVRAKRLLPGLYCPDLKTAISVKWLIGTRVRVCLHCQEIFFSHKPKQECCRRSHADAHRLIRWRSVRKGSSSQ